MPAIGIPTNPAAQYLFSLQSKAVVGSVENILQRGEGQIAMPDTDKTNLINVIETVTVSLGLLF